MSEDEKGNPAQAQSDNGESTQAITGLGIKIPPFWDSDPTMWFALLEAQFKTKSITTEGTKFTHIIASLQPEIATEVRDLILNPPKKNPYTTLKEELIKRTSASEQKRLNRLLIGEELGDRKPSQLLRRMQQLLGDKKLEGSILKQLFLQRLPMNVQLILSSTSDTASMEELARLADKIVEVASPLAIAGMQAQPPSYPHAEASAASSSHSSLAGDMQKLTAQVAQLTAQVQTLTTSLHRERSRSRSRYRNPNKRRSSPSPNRPSSICWYHHRFGERAHKCTQPCSYTPPHSSRPGNQEAGN